MDDETRVAASRKAWALYFCTQHESRFRNPYPDVPHPDAPPIPPPTSTPTSTRAKTCGRDNPRAPGSGRGVWSVRDEEEIFW